jgi:hypothetical protein
MADLSFPAMAGPGAPRDPKGGRRRSVRVAVGFWLLITALYCFIDAVNWVYLVLAAPALLVLFIFWTVVAVVAVVSVGRNLSRRDYRRAGLVALIPVIAVAAFMFGRQIGVRIIFEVERPTYVASIAPGAEIGVGPPTVAFFEWGSFLDSSMGVVFDEADTIAEPLAMRRHIWDGRRVPGDLTCPADVTSLRGHFYWVRISCGES